MEYNLGQLLDAAADVNFIFPDNTYDATIVTAEYKASAKGNHMAVVQFKVITGPYVAKPVTIRHNFVLSPGNARALDMLFQQLSNLGIPKTWFDQRRGISGKELMEQLATVLVGRVAAIKTKSDREFNGRKQVDISWINPATDAGKKAAAAAPWTVPQSTPQASPTATETVPQTQPATETLAPTVTAQEAAQSVADSDPTPSTSDSSNTSSTPASGGTGEHPAVTEAKSAADAGTGPELPF